MTSTSRRSNGGFREALRFDAGVALLGATGLAFAALVLAVIAVRGNTFIPPEGDLTKSLTFNAAVGIYYLTLAFFVPMARFSERRRGLWLTAALVLTLYSYGIETVQMFRGIDPRFSEVSSVADDIAGSLFGIAAIGQIVLFAVLVVRFFRRPASLLIVAIRYGAAATALAFIGGIVMIVIQSRFVGDGGNLLVLHAMGFHGLQALPVLAWMLERSTLDLTKARTWLHVAGIAWLIACLAVAWQIAIGRSITEPTPALAAAGMLALVWLGLFAAGLIAWVRNGRPSEETPFIAG